MARTGRMKVAMMQRRFVVFVLSVVVGIRVAAAQEISSVHRTAALPPLLRMLDGARVETNADWEKRRSEIQQLMCQYFIGTFPKEVPALLSATVLGETQLEDGKIGRAHV